MSVYAAHPAAEMFPPMSDDELASLRADMAEHGFSAAHPVLVWRGRVVDGRNRLRVAEDLGIEPEVHHLPDDADPWLAALRANATRRHLNKSALAVISVPLLEARDAELRAEAAKRKGGRPSANERKPAAALPAVSGVKPTTDATLAAEVGISERMYRGARALVNNPAAADVVEKVRRGELGVNKAEEIMAERKRAPAEVVDTKRSTNAARDARTAARRAAQTVANIAQQFREVTRAVSAVFPLVDECWDVAGDEEKQAAVQAVDEAIKALKQWRRDHT